MRLVVPPLTMLLLPVVTTRAFVPRSSTLLSRSAAATTAARAFAGTSVTTAATPFSLFSPFHKRVSRTPGRIMSLKAGFKTWTFDEACDSMDWNGLHETELVLGDDEDDESELVIVGVYAPEGDDDEEEKDDDDAEEVEVVLEGKVAELDELLGGSLKDVMTENAKTFKNGGVVGATTPTVRAVTTGEDGVVTSKRYILIGLGKANKEFKDGTLSKIGCTIATKCDSEKGVKSCSVHLPLPTDEESPSSCLSHLSQGFYTALYSDNRYRTGKKVKPTAEGLSKVVLVTSSSDDDALQKGKDLATGVYLGKDIVNAPHNILNSVSLAATAQRIAEESDGVIECEILGKEECEERGMGAYLGVARGSETPPQFIHLTYKPPSGDVKKKVGVIGKGLLFDTGGYNIKTAMMELMKFDCGGAAAVLGAARAVAALQPDGVEVHFIVAACENMINDRAVVPSDVLTASNGKTIEVVNTDAEGRLTLADALVFADKELECESIIELSTLTGACMVSLGKDVCGVWTADDALAKDIEAVSKATGDKSWRMPLVEEYKKQLESKIADMTNCGTRYGGAITAALFLQEFVEGKKPFAHIDIAGPVWDDKSGATGFGVKLVTEWITRQGKEDEEAEE